MTQLTSYRNFWNVLDALEESTRHGDGLFRTYKATFNNALHLDNNLKVDGENLTYELDIPGVKKEDVKVSISEEVLAVTYKRGDRKYQNSEYVGDVTDVKAKVQDGVLTVTMKSLKAKKLEVKVE